METKKIFLHNFTDKVYLEVFLCDDAGEYSHHKRPFMLVCPGGGYGYCSPREAEPIARRYMGYGFNTAVLYYSVNYILENPNFSMTDESSRLPLPLTEVATAISMIRDNAEEWHTDPEKIAVIGFSAGGHLAAMSGVLWNKKGLSEKIGKTNNRPDAMVLAYPVISGIDSPHIHSFYNLLGDGNPSEERLHEYSLEEHIDETTPPAFIFHTFADTCVPCENSLAFARALKKNNIPFELHILPEQEHGVSLDSGEVVSCEHSYNSRWVDWSVMWLKNTLKIFNE